MSLQQRGRAAYLSLGGAVLVLMLKLGAFLLTGSIALFSDAAESVVNVVAAFTVLLTMRLPATEEGIILGSVLRQQNARRSGRTRLYRDSF